MEDTVIFAVSIRINNFFAFLIFSAREIHCQHPVTRGYEGHILSRQSNGPINRSWTRHPSQHLGTVRFGDVHKGELFSGPFPHQCQIQQLVENRILSVLVLVVIFFEAPSAVSIDVDHDDFCNGNLVGFADRHLIA